jgi:UDP-galactose transporter B1
MWKSLPGELRLVLYVVGLYATFIYWGYLQEKLTSIKYSTYVGDEEKEWDFPFALNFFMAMAGFLVAALIELMQSAGPKISLMVFWKAALTCAMASPVGYASLKYITFPMMILTKSSKPVPVMLIGILLYRRKFPWYKYVSVALVCGGITLFSAMKKSSKAEDPSKSELTSLLFGVFLVLINLALDGFTNNEQDEIFNKYKATSIQMMKNTNVWQAIFILAYLVGMYAVLGADSELAKAVDVLTTCPGVQSDITLFCLCASVGQVLIFAVMKEFGSLAWITIAVTRKLFTILVSVFMFNHTVLPLQWAGISAVFTGLILESMMKYVDQKADAKDKKKA